MGWYGSTVVQNLVLTAAYLAPAILIVMIIVLSLRNPNVGVMATIVLWLGVCLWVFGERRMPTVDHRVLTVTGLLIISGLLSFTRPKRYRTAVGVSILVPAMVIVTTGFKPAIRAVSRIDDGIRTARVVTAQAGSLLWAPEGPGWSSRAVDWHEAVWICAHLSDDGLRVEPIAAYRWRLPTLEELVRSLTSRGVNAGGEPPTQHHSARYRERPEKESPLWNKRSPIIYWWTSTEARERAEGSAAYAVCFDGRVVAAAKTSVFRGRGFRAVRPWRGTGSSSQGPGRSRVHLPSPKKLD